MNCTWPFDDSYQCAFTQVKMAGTPRAAGPPPNMVGAGVPRIESGAGSAGPLYVTC